MFVVVWGATEAPQSHKAAQARHVGGTAANPCGAGLGDSNHCSLKVYGHIPVSSHSLGQFGCSEKLLLQFKERNGRPEGEYKDPG